MPCIVHPRHNKQFFDLVLLTMHGYINRDFSQHNSNIPPSIVNEFFLLPSLSFCPLRRVTHYQFPPLILSITYHTFLLVYPVEDLCGFAVKKIIYLFIS